MIYGKKISLVIPCRNEEDGLKRLIPRIPKSVDEVIVVDNNSTDKTFVTAKKLGTKILKEIRQVNGIGYGFAHQTGLSAANGDYIVCMDGDESYPLERIKSLVGIMEKKNLDFVSCYRYNGKKEPGISWPRYLGGKVLAVTFGLLYGQKMHDILTGMWIIKSSKLPHLVAQEGGWNYSIEIKLCAVISRHIKFAEISIPYHDRHVGKSKQSLVKTGIDHFWFLIKTRVGMINRGQLSPVLNLGR